MILAAAASLLLSMVALVGVVTVRNAKTAQPVVAAVADPAALTREHAASFGNPAAKVHIVEFLDPACETCAQFYPLVKKLIAANPERIRLSVRHVAFHKGSDVVVKLLEASKKQGRYWQTLETLLASQSTWAVQHTVRPELVWPQLGPAGLDLERLKADMETPETAANIATDARDAKTLKVVQTPEYFVNGRPLPTFGYDPLQQLVAQALADAYR